MLDIDRIRALLSGTAAQGYDFYERRTGALQLIIPILHEDGDMVDIYLQDSPLGEGPRPHLRFWYDADEAVLYLRHSHRCQTEDF